MNNLSTRTRLILLVLLAGLPALALIGYSAISQRAAAIEHAREDLLSRARQAAGQQEQIIEGARQMLVALSHVPAVADGDPVRCHEFLARLLKDTTDLYRTLGLLRPDGVAVCNAFTIPPGLSARDRLYFNLAMASGSFAVGDYQVGRVTRQAGINFAYPIKNAQGAITAVAFTTLDLARFNTIAVATPLPEQGTLLIVDRNGTILSRSPEPADLIGKKLRDPRLIDNMLTNHNGVMETVGIRGDARLTAFDAVGKSADGSVPIRVVVSMPLNVIYADADRLLVRNLVWFLAATILLLLGAWYGAEIFVLRQIRMLLATAKRLHAGDLTARTGMRYENEELSQIGQAFDEMATALQARDAGLNQALQDLHTQAITDSLTGLYNRRYLHELLPRELLRAKRNGNPVAVIMLDIDHFKRVNDTHGHEAGDYVLKEIGALLRKNVRDVDIACRYGGEEFCLVLPDAPLEIARRKAEDIRAALAQRELNYCGKPLKITASLGVAVYPDHGTGTDFLLRAADEALYGAKGAGRDRVVIYVAGKSRGAAAS